MKEKTTEMLNFPPGFPLMPLNSFRLMVYFCHSSTAEIHLMLVDLQPRE